MKNQVLLGISLLAIFGGGFLFSGGSSSPSLANGEHIIVYKSLNCGCCSGYVNVLEASNYDVEVVNLSQDDLDKIKAERGIPRSMQSCHTAIVGDYFIEGHVPLEAVSKLLTEKPDVDGIALPGMPVGSPGMPGLKPSAFEVVSIKDGVQGTFTTV